VCAFGAKADIALQPRYLLAKIRQYVPIGRELLHCMSLLLAQSGHFEIPMSAFGGKADM
jgi:hypothetical protein